MGGMKSVKISEELHKFLTEQAVIKGESYDAILKRLLKQHWNVELVNSVEAVEGK